MNEKPCDPKDVALAALTNLIRLMGAELVAGAHRDDINFLEQAMRAKVGAVIVKGCASEIADAGLALARDHVERAITRVRSQALSANVPKTPRALSAQNPANPVFH